MGVGGSDSNKKLIDSQVLLILYIELASSDVDSKTYYNWYFKTTYTHLSPTRAQTMMFEVVCMDF